jgi:hypothetical protein
MNEATSNWVKIAWFDRKLANKEKEGRASIWGRKTNTTGGYNILYKDWISPTELLFSNLFLGIIVTINSKTKIINQNQKTICYFIEHV